MKKLTFIICVVVLAGCGSAPEEKSAEALSEPFIIKIEPGKQSEKGGPSMSDIIDSLEYIKLEFNQKFPIGNISSRPYINNDYIFLDCHPSGLLQYTRNGKFVRQIGAYAVDEKAGIVYTVPNFKKVIDKYDYHTGKYLGGMPILGSDGKPVRDKNIASFYNYSDTEFLAVPSDLNKYNDPYVDVVYFIDKATGQISSHQRSNTYGLELYKLKTEGYTIFVGEKGWQDTKNRYNVQEEMSDTIYVINADYALSPRIILDRGDYKPDLQASYEEREYYKTKIMTENFLDSPEYIVYLWSYNDKRYVSSFNKITGEQHLLSASPVPEYKPGIPTKEQYFQGLYNDIDGGFSSLKSYDQDKWCRTFDAYRLIEDLDEDHFSEVKSKVKYPERIEKLQKFISTLTDEDNPVLVIAHLKK